VINLFAQAKANKRARLYRDLIRREASIGGKLFGPIPKNGRREFFCLDDRTWIWHEEWDDEKGVHHAVTTRYDVRPQGIFKAQDHQPYQRLSYQEARRLIKAINMYRDAVRDEMYSNF
jgi:hypothetical protein